MAYDAFISYSHAADGRLAPALQSGLHRLAKPWFRLRALRVFRDETGLSTNPHLWSSIVAALDEAEWFVLLASPESATSPWVDKEIAHWLESKPASRILPVVTAGEWNWDPATGRLEGDAVPERLAAAITEEPRHLDLRFAHNETDLDLRNSRFRSAIADLAAPMHDVAKDDLEGEDIRQHRRTQRLARGAVSALIALVVVALVATAFAINRSNQADHNASRAAANADESQARSLASEAEILLRSNRIDQALLVAVEAQRIAAHAPHGGAAATRSQIALLRALTAGPAITGFLPGQHDAPATIRYSPDGNLVVSVSNTGEIHAWDASTRRLLPGQPRLRLAGAASVAVNDAGLLAITSGKVEKLWDLKNNRPWHWQPPRRHDDAEVFTGVHFAQVALSESGRLAIASSNGVGSTLYVWDVNSGHRIGAPLQIGGTTYPNGGHVKSLTFSPDSSQIAVSFVPVANIGGLPTTLFVQLVDASTAKGGLLLDAHYGSYSYYLAPFVDALVYSPDGNRISSVASRGPATVPFRKPTTDGAIATFDTRTGARIDSSVVGAGMEFMGVSPDLHELAMSNGNTMSVLDARSGARLATLPIPGLDPMAPVAFDPKRPNVVVQSGPGALTVADWTQIGARPFVSRTPDKRLPASTIVAPSGAPVDLTVALKRLGLSTGCFAPLVSSCDYETDRLEIPSLDNYYHHRIRLSADDPRRPWSATASAAGPVAIVSGGTIAIWNPKTQHIERRLSGVPQVCQGFYPRDLAFIGTAHDGRIVLACLPKLVSWDLASATSKPAWTQSWVGLDPGTDTTPPGVALSEDGHRGATATQGKIRFFDPYTGRAGPRAPVTTWDGVTAILFVSDGSLAQLHTSGALDLVKSVDGSLQRTLVSSTGNVSDFGVPLSFLGTSGVPPVIAFGGNKTMVAVWHDSIGLEVWDRGTGESLAVLGGLVSDPAGTISTLSGTGDIDLPGKHRLTVAFDRGGNALRVIDVRELIPVVNGVPAHEYSSLLRTVAWSLRPSDWVLAACTIAGRDLTHQEWNELVGANMPYHRTCSPLLRTGAH